MLDLRLAAKPPRITHTFDLYTSRAIQCAVPDPVTGHWFVSQADGFGNREGIHISRQILNPVGRWTRPDTMHLPAVNGVPAGHGTTIATLTRDGQLGIVVFAWGRLRWIPYRSGKVIEGAPIWKGSGAYIDHEAGTVCLRLAAGHYLLHQLDGEKLGAKLGEITVDMTSSGPYQGFATGKRGNDYYLTTMWDYGRPSSRPAVVVGSFTQNKRLYAISARLLDKSYERQEPESGVFIGGEFHLGMSLVHRDPKTKRATKSGVLLDMSAPDLVTMWVRPANDPIWAPDNKNPRLVNRAADGVSRGDQERPPGFKVVGELVELHDGLHIRVKSGRYYAVRYLTRKRPLK